MLTRFFSKSFSSIKAANLDDKIKSWFQRVQGLAENPQSKAAVSQLSSLVNYYTKKAEDVDKPINWEEWQSRITTDGLVKKVKQNYKSLNEKQYDVEGIVSKINSQQSKALENIRNELTFHTALWLENYSKYVQFMFDLENHHRDLSGLEETDMFRDVEPTVQELSETHNHCLGSKDDINLYNYMANQFGWGKKVVSFYRHPADDFKCYRATKNALGR